ncbi:protease inhibitor I42 family protein [Methanosarcina sp. KYL-1]|uniref:protease inhibitor I42 family protein n=1 Tax=Methanosarcina sp. KYL-1 TaxID=2602068 RepID=UPI002100EAD2|nr:protease inhibitor I42 family protein [Methanosarcina sp. KYL-1]MCQ1535874.1 protease inhibitor I42 family protein [Methanosarcina sp. KYL-1]
MSKILKAIAVLLLIAAVLFAAGCTEKTETPGNETPGNETTETGMVVTEADSGKTVSLKKGENFTLKLRENPSTGASWQLNLSEGLSILDDYYTQDPAPEGEVGVPGNHTWIIEAAAPGSQQIDGIYKQSWMNTTGEEETFKLTVEVV